MKKDKSYKKGFTLFETLVSTITFGILMILMFNMSSQFFRIFTTSESKQSVNTKFITAYREMYKKLLITDVMYIYSYRTDFTFMKSRWLFFPVPTDKNSIVKGEGNSFNWQRIYIYYLTCTNSNCPECPTKTNDKYDPYRYCSDKQLIRLIYNYTAPTESNFFSTAISKMSEDISNYILAYDSIFPLNVEYDINGDTTQIAEFVEKKIIATDILDLDIKETMSNVTVKISTVRKADLKKEVIYGKTDFTTESASKFVNKMEFTVEIKNN